LAAEASWGNTVDSIWSTAVIIDTNGNLLNSNILTDDQFTSILDITYDGKLVYASNIYVNNQFDVILTKLNQNLEQDTLYTFPYTYDSLCPYQIVSDTIVQDDCGLIVGVEEDTVEPGDRGRLVIFPNPSSGGLSVKVLGLSAGNNSSTFSLQLSIAVYDIFGRKVHSPCPQVSLSPGQNNRDGGWQLDVSALPPGIYFVVVWDDKSVIGTGKFVVAR
jgi:Secretion system C-terminal sorting domain